MSKKRQHNIWESKPAQVKKSKVRPILIFSCVAACVAAGVLGMYTISKHASRISFKLPTFALPSIPVPGMKKTNMMYADTFDTISHVITNKTDIVVVDIRDTEQFQERHIKHTINVPFSTTRQTGFVKEVQKQAKGRPIVIVPYSMYATEGEEAYELLRSAGVHVSVMKAGWNEIYSLPNIWIPEEKLRNFSMNTWLETSD